VGPVRRLEGESGTVLLIPLTHNAAHAVIARRATTVFMTMFEKSGVGADEDYRLSHLSRGGTYDATLAAAPFDAYMARFEGQHLRRIIPTLFPSAPPRYVDFACGTGRITEVVAPMCAEAVGVDVSPEMLQQARRKCPTVRFVQADLTTQTDLDLGSFDLVTAFRFFGNAQQSLRMAALSAIHRLLRLGGCLVLNSHRNPHAVAALLHAATGGGSGGMDLNYLKLRSMLRRFGFEVEQAIPVGVWMYRSKLLTVEHRPERAERLEQRFRFPALAPVAPDVVVVARKIRAAAPIA
jgi:SAM-dependent methyltransferase